MSWFFFALVCVFGWGLADLFYKTGSSEDDRYSHLKIAVWVGIVMGAVSLLLMVLGRDRAFGFRPLYSGLLIYSPASLSYIISMVIGYAGLRYLELSIVSPVQNASGALSAILMIVWFAITGSLNKVSEEFSALDIIGTVLITGGVIVLAVCEQRLSKAEDQAVFGDEKRSRKYRTGALALIFPLLYCFFDTIGTAADGILLSSPEMSLLSETDVLILYGLTFFLAGIVCFFIIKIKSGSFYNPFKKSECPKLYAAVAEEFGQVFYIYAMAENPVFAAPMVASYCVISMLLSRIFLKERLDDRQNICLAFIITGILMLGISEGTG